MPKTTLNQESSATIEQLKSRSVRGVFSYFLRTFVLQGVGLIALLLLSKFLEPSDFGIYGLVTQIIGLLVFFSDVGLAAVLVQKKDPPSEKDYRVAFTLQQILSWLIVWVVLCLILSGVLDNKIGSSGKWLLLSLAVSFPLATLKTIPSIMLERELNFSKLIIPQIFEQLVFHSIVVIMAWKGFGVIAYAYGVILRSLVGVIVMNTLKPWQIGVSLDKTVIKNLVGFGIKFQLNDFLARIKDQLFYLAVGWYLPSREFGYVTWAKNWSMYPYNLTVQNIMTVTFPTFSRIQEQKDLLKKAIEKSIFSVTLVVFPLLTGMCVFIYSFTQVFADYQKWQPAIISFILFCLSIVWSAVSTPLNNTLNALGQINVTLKLMTFWTILTWILTPVTIIFYGYNGVALAALLISFTSILSVICAKKFVNFSFVDQVWRQFLASILMALVGIGSTFYVVRPSQLLLAMIVTGSSYLVIVWIIASNKIRSEIWPIFRILTSKMLK